MRSLLLVSGVALLALGLAVAIGEAAEVSRCEAVNAPCSGACPDVLVACPIGAEFLGIGMAIAGAAVVPIGIWTKSANRIDEEALARLDR
jgi:hypothetical protein